jgi:hypothetical protein
MACNGNGCVIKFSGAVDQHFLTMFDVVDGIFSSMKVKLDFLYRAGKTIFVVLSGLVYMLAGVFCF